MAKGGTEVIGQHAAETEARDTAERAGTTTTLSVTGLSIEQGSIRSAFIARISKSSPLIAGDATRMEVPVDDRRALRGAYVSHLAHETGEAAGNWSLPDNDILRHACAVHMAALDNFPIGSATRPGAPSGKNTKVSRTKAAAQRAKAQKRLRRPK